MSAPVVRVAAAVITDASEQLLVSLNESWGAFTLPMSRIRTGPDADETPEFAAVRAAAEVLGVPVRLGAGRYQVGLLELSGRELAEKTYAVHLVRVEPHPAFADRLAIRAPHFWAAPFLLAEGHYEPLSPMLPRLVRTIQAEFGVPDRLQPVTTVILTRASPEGQRFLLRWSPKWAAWNFPSRRRDPDDAPSDAFAALARKELGVETVAGLEIRPDEFVIDSVPSGNRAKPWRDVRTRYRHLVGLAEWAGAEDPKSDEELRWVTADELAETKLPKGGGLVSATARELATRLFDSVRDAVANRDDRDFRKFVSELEKERDGTRAGHGDGRA